jgi:2-polyprenyl-3-methyl-5-hydroxy-6-metoxy-1,4-benzoquinol methylase
MEKLAYDSKDSDYYRNSRKDLIDKVECRNHTKILDVGCGTGINLGYVKSKAPLSTTVGVELYAVVSSEQLIDRIYQCNIEDFLDNESEKDFDLIMCLDSLEHIWNYKEVLSNLAGLMKDDGVLLISVPNVSNFRTFYNIFLRKDFPKMKDGIFDETHCRWFTKKVLKNDLLEIGFNSIEFSYTGMEKGKILYFVDLITFGMLRDYLGFQIVAVAKRSVC